MKTKTLISGLLLGCVMGTAFAVPTPEDRRKLCEHNPEKFIWVEKDIWSDGHRIKGGVCIPRNPCLSDMEEIKDAYCVDLDMHLNYQNHIAVIERYIKNVLKKDVENALWEDKIEGHYYTFARVGLNDGGFVQIQYVLDGSYVPSGDVATDYACRVYGFKNDCNDKANEMFHRDKFERLRGFTCACQNVKSDKLCTDIADFASLIKGDVCVGKIVDENCEITCEKQGGIY